MKLAAALILSLLVQDEKYAKAAEKIKLPAKADLDALAAKSDRHKRTIAMISDRANWAAGLKRIEEKLGMFTETPKIEILVEESTDPKPAKAGGEDGAGAIKFNVTFYVAFLKRLDDVAETRKYGKDARWVIPPAKLDALMIHELVHCFAGTFEQQWMTEGIASWVAGDDSILWDFAYKKRAVNGLDQLVTEDDAYARGWAFLEWIHSLGDGKLEAFLKTILKDRKAVKKAAETASGKDWATLVLVERDWSRAFIKGYADKIER